jgi:hypothetical protein
VYTIANQLLSPNTELWLYDKYDFPDLLNYTRFLEVMPKALAPLTGYFTNIKGEPTGS